MKLLASYLLVIAFISISVFGVVAMGHHESGGNCIASITESKNCHNEQNPLTAAAFHLGKFTSYSTAVFGETAGSSLLVNILPAWILAGFPDNRSLNAPVLISEKSRTGRNPFGYERQLHPWLALLRQTDPDLS